MAGRVLGRPGKSSDQCEEQLHDGQSMDNERHDEVTHKSSPYLYKLIHITYVH